MVRDSRINHTGHAEGVKSSIFHWPFHFDRLILNLGWSQLVSSIRTDTTVISNLQMPKKM